MEDYDFRLNTSLYKILGTKMNMTTALNTCQNELEGGGWVMSVKSESEINEIATELVMRHEGYELEYWVFGNVTDNFTLSQLSSPPQPGNIYQLHPFQSNNAEERQIYWMLLQ